MIDIGQRRRGQRGERAFVDDGVRILRRIGGRARHGGEGRQPPAPCGELTRREELPHAVGIRRQYMPRHHPLDASIKGAGIVLRQQAQGARDPALIDGLGDLRLRQQPARFGGEEQSGAAPNEQRPYTEGIARQQQAPRRPNTTPRQGCLVAQGRESAGSSVMAARERAMSGGETESPVRTQAPAMAMKPPGVECAHYPAQAQISRRLP